VQKGAVATKGPQNCSGTHLPYWTARWGKQRRSRWLFASDQPSCTSWRRWPPPQQNTRHTNTISNSRKYNHFTLSTFNIKRTSTCQESCAVHMSIHAAIYLQTQIVDPASTQNHICSCCQDFLCPLLRHVRLPLPNALQFLWVRYQHLETAIHNCINQKLMGPVSFNTAA
jgi:hypothetical protein